MYVGLKRHVKMANVTVRAYPQFKKALENNTACLVDRIESFSKKLKGPQQLEFITGLRQCPNLRDLDLSFFFLVNADNIVWKELLVSLKALTYLSRLNLIGSVSVTFVVVSLMIQRRVIAFKKQSFFCQIFILI